MSHDDLNLIKLELDRHSASEIAPSQLAHQIETIAAASRTLEGALLRERNYSKQLREYVNQVIARMHFFQKQEQETTERLKELQSNRDQNTKQAQELAAELQKARNELAQYRNAWGQILAREKHAQYILSRGEVSVKRIQELELALSTLEKRIEAEKSGREKAEGHASTHRQELQTALVRLHSSEARYNDMARELEAIHTLRKNHTLELSRVEQIAREKFEAQLSREREQLAREREQLLAELAKEREEYLRNRADVEKIRTESEQARERLRREMELKLNSEVQRFTAQAEETAKMKSMIRSLGDESKALRSELSQSRSEVSSIEQSSRQAELDLLRSREEVASLQKQLTEERGKRSALDQALQTAEKSAERAAEKAKGDLEDQRERTLRLNQEFYELIQSDRKQMQAMIEKLIEAWGAEDEALCSALEALRDACEVRTVRTDAPPAKLEIVTTGGSRLNC